MQENKLSVGKKNVWVHEYLSKEHVGGWKQNDFLKKDWWD